MTTLTSDPATCTSSIDAASSTPRTLHWPEYLIEAGSLAAFMVSATLATTLLEYHSSPIHQAIAHAAIRRTIIGVLMGLTAIAIIYSGPGRRSGAHMNPATTLAFLWCRKITHVDAAFYVAAQFLGGFLGMAATTLLPWAHADDQAVNFIVTVPGQTGTSGVVLAFVAETGMSFTLLLSALVLSNHRRAAPFTGIAVGILVATFIALLAPISGMSINPARTVGSAIVSGNYQSLWLYMVAPPLGMFGAAAAYQCLARRGRTLLGAIRCAKLCHLGHSKCIFRCGYCVHPSPGSGI